MNVTLCTGCLLHLAANLTLVYKPALNPFTESPLAIVSTLSQVTMLAGGTLNPLNPLKCSDPLRTLAVFYIWLHSQPSQHKTLSTPYSARNWLSSTFGC